MVKSSVVESTKNQAVASADNNAATTVATGAETPAENAPEIPTVHHYIAHAILDIIRCLGSANLETICNQLVAIGQMRKIEPKKVAKYCQEIIDWEIASLDANGMLTLIPQGLSMVELEALHNKLWTAEMVKRCPARQAAKAMPVLKAKAKA